MAGDFAHEFLTPLTTIQSNLEAMLDGVYEPTSERLENLKLEVERVSRMVYDIDKLVALTNENIELNKEQFDLTPVIDQVLTTFEREIHNKKIINL
jgi:signal transduction histidine kinase